MNPQPSDTSRRACLQRPAGPVGSGEGRAWAERGLGSHKHPAQFKMPSSNPSTSHKEAGARPPASPLADHRGAGASCSARSGSIDYQTQAPPIAVPPFCMLSSVFFLLANLLEELFGLGSDGPHRAVRGLG